jgi:hypothetical protein
MCARIALTSARNEGQSFQTQKLKRSSMTSIMRDRSIWRIVTRNANSSIGELTMEEDMLQGVHRSIFRLSVEKGA